MKNKISLNTLIYKSYLTSTLIPIFTIEVVLLLLYFGVTYFITQKSQEILLSEATQNLSEIVVRESRNINSQFEEVSRGLELLRLDHTRFFEDDVCSFPNKEAIFARHANGALYKKVDNGGASIYAPNNFEINAARQRKIECSEAIDPLMKSLVDTNPIITQAYINTYDKLNRLYPFMVDAPLQYGKDLDATSYNFYYLADAVHNPQRKNVWTSAYLDPAGQGWMISNITPVYKKDFLEGVTGVDVTIDSLVKNVLSLAIPWEGSAFLVDADGMILAMPKKIEELVALKELKAHTYEGQVATTIEKPEEYNIFRTKDTSFKSVMDSFFNNSTKVAFFQKKNENYIIAQEVIPETGWRIMVVVDTSVIYKKLEAFKAQAQSIGYVVLAFMVLFYILFFIYLTKKSKTVATVISQPINNLSELTRNLGYKPQSPLSDETRIDEIYGLIHNFNMLSKELDTRTQEYIQAQMREKMKERDAEIAYRAGLFESASSYLHNVGNSLTMLDAKLLSLRSTVASLKKSELGFDKSIEMIQNLETKEEPKNNLLLFMYAFKVALSDEITAEIITISDEMASIKEHAVQTIRHQQDQFNNNDSTKSFTQTFSLNEMLEDIIEDYRIQCMQNGIRVFFEAEDEYSIQTVKYRLQSGIINVFKNAIESILASTQRQGGLIEITLRKRDARVVIELKDNGTGIAAQDENKLFTFGFSTKENGNGLGLHAFNNFLNSTHATIMMQNNPNNIGVTTSIILGERDV